MKKTFLTMTALSALVLISPGLQGTAAANKPMIRIAKPNIKVKVNTKRLINKATTRKTGKGIVKAGPQPEPPTRPGFNSTPTAMIAPPLPRPRPETAHAGPDNDVFDHIVETLLSIEPPNEGDPEAYDEFQEDEDGLIGDIDAPAGPELVLSNGFEDVFLVFGGVTPDFEFPAGAIPEFPGAGPGGNPFEDPASRLRRPRYGEGMDGPPAGGGDAPNSGGLMHLDGEENDADKDNRPPRTSADDWQQADNETEDGDTRSTAGRTNENGEKETWEETNHANGRTTIDQTTTNGNTTTVIRITLGPVAADGSRQADVYAGQGDGTFDHVYTTTTNTGSVPTPMDRNADGRPDGTIRPPAVKDFGRRQPAPDDNNTGRGTGGCGMWTPLGGCTGTGPKVWDTTGQPNPADDGSATVRSAGASIGPEAVTNGGDGSFGAEGNSGRGGRFGIDPCATVAGCGDGSGGPDNPVGSVDAAHAADS